MRTLSVTVSPNGTEESLPLKFLSEKTFTYLTPVLKILPCHFKGGVILGSQSFHFLADPDEIKEQVQQLLALRREASIGTSTLILWEPRPSSCTPANKDAIFEAAFLVDIFSPNHIELSALFGQSTPVPFDSSAVEELALLFITSGIGSAGQGAVVIRAGEHGCFIASSTQAPRWLPAYYEPSKESVEVVAASPTKIVDPTGAGNAFLSAFTIGLLDTDSLYDAACYGTVGSSFAVEQIGLPSLGVIDGEEVWNGERVLSRLEEYRLRMG